MDFLFKLFYSDVFFTFVIEHPSLYNFLQVIIYIIYLLMFAYISYVIYFNRFAKLYISMMSIFSIIMIIFLLPYYSDKFKQYDVDGINYYIHQNPNGLYSKQITEHCIPEYLNKYKNAEFYPFVLSCVREYVKENIRIERIEMRNARKRQDRQIKLNNRRQEEEKVKEQFHIDN